MLWVPDGEARMSDRLKPFSTDELHAVIFAMDIATTVEPLVPEAELIRQELIDELRERRPDPR